MPIKIKVETLPLHFLILGGFLILYALFNLVAGYYIILHSIILILGILLLTSHQGLSIKTDERIYSEYYWVFGMKLSNYSEPYKEIISLACTTGRYSQEYGKYNRRFISGTMFLGYIELKDQEPIFIGQNKSKSALMNKLRNISHQLKVPVEDKTNDDT